MSTDNYATVSYYVVNFDKVVFRKKQPYTLVFTGYIPTFGRGEYRFTYTGTELNTTASMPEEVRALLKEMLNEDYGYGPFDGKEANEQLKKKMQYRMPMSSNYPL